MDEAFSIFLESFERPVDRQEVPVSSIERYRNKLPDLLLEYWAEHGWCGYGEGIFWTVNPQEYDAVVASWIGSTELAARDNYHVIARSAFGDLYLWGEQTGFSLKITSVLSRFVLQDLELADQSMEREVQEFFVMVNVEDNDYGDLFQPAKEKLGILRHDEMYGFVPALMFGGPDILEHLQKVKAVEHLILLSQITELKPYGFSDL